MLAQDQADPDHGLRYYDNLTGCGNTIDAANPVTRRLVLDSMRYLAGTFGIDGFRFDLGAVWPDLPPSDPLSDADPQFDRLAPFFEMVADDPGAGQAEAHCRTVDGGCRLRGAVSRPLESVERRSFRDDVRDFWREPPPPAAGPRYARWRTVSPEVRTGSRPASAPRRVVTAPVGIDQSGDLPRRFHARGPRLIQRETEHSEPQQ